MALNNYTDISKNFSAADAGFQFEFKCNGCPTKWKSPLKPYKRGRLVGLIYGLGYIVSGTRGPEALSRRIADSGADPARQEALVEAQARAASHFTECDNCHKAYCADCYDENAGLCNDCARQTRGSNGSARGNNHGGNNYGGGYDNGGSSSAAGAMSCPNCSTPNHGGRFCAECGFDMASTHKSCPQCGAMCDRGSRFCTDCGHGF